jgi:outer membrane protein assembly factor BamB
VQAATGPTDGELALGRNGRRLAPLLVLLVVSACTGPGGGPVEPVVSFAPADRLPKIELWDETTGWRELPRAPLRAPTERWRIPVRPDEGASHHVADGVIAMVDRVGGIPTVRRIDPATGSNLWSVPVPGLVTPADIDISGGGSLIVAGDPSDDGDTVVVSAADGRLIWRGDKVGSVRLVEAIGDLIVVGGGGTRVIERGTGALRWQTDERLTVSNPVLLRDDPVNAVLGVLDPASGATVWQLPRGDDSDPHAVGDTLLVTRDEDGPHDSATAYDLATGAQRWRTDLINIRRTHVTAIDDDTVLINGGDGPSVNETAVVTLTTGEVPWLPGRGATTAMRIDGQPYVVVESDRNTLVHRGTTGEVANRAQLPEAEDSATAGGASYRATGGEVIAVRLPELSGQWRTPIPDGEVEISPIPNGFVLTDFSNPTKQLIGYLQ